MREKRRCFKLWKAGGSQAAYNPANESVSFQKIDPKSADISSCQANTT